MADWETHISRKFGTQRNRKHCACFMSYDTIPVYGASFLCADDLWWRPRSEYIFCTWPLLMNVPFQFVLSFHLLQLASLASLRSIDVLRYGQQECFVAVVSKAITCLSCHFITFSIVSVLLRCARFAFCARAYNIEFHTNCLIGFGLENFINKSKRPPVLVSFYF